MTTFNKYFLERICKLTNNVTKEVITHKQFNHFRTIEKSYYSHTKEIIRETYKSHTSYYYAYDKNYYYIFYRECTTL